MYATTTTDNDNNNARPRGCTTFRILLLVLCVITVGTQIWAMATMVPGMDGPGTVVTDSFGEHPHQDSPPTNHDQDHPMINATLPVPQTDITSIIHATTTTHDISNGQDHRSDEQRETAMDVESPNFSNNNTLPSTIIITAEEEELRKQQFKERSAKMQFLRQFFPGIPKLQGLRKTKKKKEVDFVHRLYPSPTTTTTLSNQNHHNNNNENDIDGPCKKRQVDEIQIHVIGWKRVEGIQSLLNTLQNSNYSGWDQQIPLYIHIDGGSVPELSTVVQQFSWTHGPKYIDQGMENIGLRNMWLTSIGKAAKDAGTSTSTLLLVLEDDLQIAPVYFQWLLRMIDQYAPNPHCRDADLVGFSLSPIVFQEIFFPFSFWNPDEELQGIYLPKTTRHSAYLTTVPSSWGAAYWSDHWNRFQDFVTERMKPPFYNLTAESASSSASSMVLSTDVTPEYLHIRGAAPNRWTKSWKRFMVDFMYAQGKVMLYPNFPHQRALAKALQADGEHGISRNNSRDNPYMADLITLDEWSQGDWEKQLPPYNDLMVFGLDHKARSRELVVALGTDHLNRIAEECQHNCSELLKVWARPGWAIPSRSKDGYPFICVMDMYTSTAAWSRRPLPWNHGSDEKFLMIILEPSSSSTTFQSSAMVQAYLWALVLNRTLVLPTNIDEEQLLVDWRAFRSQKKIDKTRYRALYKNRKTISMQEFSSRNSTAWRMIRVSSSRSSTSQTQHFWSKLEIVDLRHLLDQTLPIDTIKHLFRGCNDDVLAIDGEYFGNHELVAGS